MLTTLGVVQIPLLATMLLGGCAAKLGRVVRGRSFNAALGPTALFPLRLQRWAAFMLCAVEFACGIGLILTVGRIANPAVAELVRLGTGLLFVVATCALIELRSVRPDVGCGCFGEFSTAPITWRTIARSSLLALSALGTIKLGPIEPPGTIRGAVSVVALLLAEFALFGLLSPEVRDVLVRIGYSAPCELRTPSTDHTLAVLQRSTQWRKHAWLIAGQRPADMWRELCWRYITYPTTVSDKDAELVYAVYLQHRRPVVFSVLVDAATGAILPWPASTDRALHWWRRPVGSWQWQPVRRPVSAFFGSLAMTVESLIKINKAALSWAARAGTGRSAGR